MLQRFDRDPAARERLIMLEWDGVVEEKRMIERESKKFWSAVQHLVSVVACHSQSSR